jgi:hypothetical protein
VKKQYKVSLNGGENQYLWLTEAEAAQYRRDGYTVQEV